MEEKNRHRWNVGVVSLAFLLVFSAFFSGQMIQPAAMIDFADSSNGTFSGDTGFLSLSIVYAVLGFGNFLAPSVVYVIGAKLTLIIAALVHACYLATMIYPMEWLIYLISPIHGFAGSLIWCAQGNLVVRNSTRKTLSTHLGIFMIFLQSAWIVGGIIQYSIFSVHDSFDDDIRMILFGIFSGIAVLGAITCLALIPGENDADFVTKDGKAPSACGKVLAGIKDTVSILCTKDMMILAIAFFHHGLMSAFERSIYPTCLGQNEWFGHLRNSYVGLFSVGLGIGGIAASIMQGPLAKYTYHWGRTPVVLFGTLLQLIVYTLSYVLMPSSCSFESSGPSNNETIYWIDMMGFSDISGLHTATWLSIAMCVTDVIVLTLILQLVGLLYSSKSAAGYALFKLFESIAIATAYFYSIILPFEYHVLVVLIGCPLCAFSLIYTIRVYENGIGSKKHVPFGQAQVQPIEGKKSPDDYEMTVAAVSSGKLAEVAAANNVVVGAPVFRRKSSVVEEEAF